MRVSQAVWGVFHHFELARELDRRGHLDTVFSTWPWTRLKREGLPHSKVQTFPWLHTPLTVLNRIGTLPVWLDDELGYQNALRFDDWTARRIGRIDALIALSGAALKTGRMLQQRGGVFICDRGSTHHSYQAAIVAGEFQRWGLDPRAPIPATPCARRPSTMWRMPSPYPLPFRAVRSSRWESRPRRFTPFRTESGLKLSPGSPTHARTPSTCSSPDTSRYAKAFPTCLRHLPAQPSR